MSLDTQETVLARVEPRVKAEVETVLARLGMTHQELIGRLYEVVATTRELPLDLLLPNAETREALEEADRGVGLTKYNSVEDLFKDLGL